MSGYPKSIRVDNGPENLSAEFVRWGLHHIVIQYIQPGKPAQNAYVERFNRSYREEVLDLYLFRSLAEVRKITDQWLRHYNDSRPHESLNFLSPRQFAGLTTANVISTSEQS